MQLPTPPARPAPIRCLVLAVAVAASSGAMAKSPVIPGLSGGGSLPLGEILDLAKPYPNLVMQVRLQLVRANLKREQVVCTANRFGKQWSALGGARVAPYECAIGKRTLAVAANQIFYDRNGRKVAATDPDLMRKAIKVKEGGLTWRWK